MKNILRSLIGLRVSRKCFELCLFTQMMSELKSGDLAKSGADKFSDYKLQPLSID